MRHLKSILLALSIVSLGVMEAHDAAACGGCFISQTEQGTQVTGHRMLLSLSQSGTTLWDQIKYAGNPKDFGWILPINGGSGFNLDTDFDVSSDALFSTLEQLTDVTVTSPFISCTPPTCNTGGATGGFDNGGAGGSGDPGVVVVGEKVAGPFQIVHLKATDPSALTSWLSTNNYVVPADVKPVVDAYVAEGFDFVAMKLANTDTLSAMRPVRVKLPGASPVLPLRMVAAGTGALTSITLWVVGEGRYEPTNFPTFEINQQDIVWNWDTSSSNYKDLKQAGYDASNGKAWLVEAAEPASTFSIQFPLEDVVNFDVANSGYGDAADMYAKAHDQLYADLGALFGSIPEASMWLMRFHGELPRSALASDLALGASMNQASVTRYFQASKATGTEPSCPPPPECPPPPDSNPGTWDGYYGSTSTGGGGCAMGGDSSSSAALSGLALSAALALARRRRRR